MADNNNEHRLTLDNIKSIMEAYNIHDEKNHKTKPDATLEVTMVCGPKDKKFERKYLMFKDSLGILRFPIHPRLDLSNILRLDLLSLEWQQSNDFVKLFTYLDLVASQGNSQQYIIDVYSGIPDLMPNEDLAFRMKFSHQTKVIFFTKTPEEDEEDSDDEEDGDDEEVVPE